MQWSTRVIKRFTQSHASIIHAYCSRPDDRVPGDNIDDDIYGYHDSTDSKMWQDSLPHKNVLKLTDSFNHMNPQLQI